MTGTKDTAEPEARLAHFPISWLAMVMGLAGLGDRMVAGRSHPEVSRRAELLCFWGLSLIPLTILSLVLASLVVHTARAISRKEICLEEGQRSTDATTKRGEHA